jgi:dienelactone hydrolase
VFPFYPEGVEVRSKNGPGGQSRPLSRTKRTLATLALTLALTGSGLTVAAPASADEIGQAPTAANITGNGSFTVSSTGITGASGFGGGTVYYPTTAGTYPVVAIVSGFLSSWSAINWIGPRLSSWGFVVVGIDTTTIFDDPDSRGSQLLAALNWAVGPSSPSAVRARADSSRRGVAGWSMGGGGTLKALSQDTTGTVKAGVPLAPWNNDKSWNEVSEPVLQIGGESDIVAAPRDHALQFYNSLGGPKTYVELNDADHFFPTSQNATVSRALVSWFKRYLNSDTRFTQFTCGFTGSAISSFQTNAC